MSSDPAGQVAQGNADLIFAAAQDALNEVAWLDGRLGPILPSIDTDLSDAGLALTIAYHAFLQAESALYYPDPGAEDQWTQPFGSLDSGTLSPETPGVASVGRQLAEYPSIPHGSFGIPDSRPAALENLKVETADLRASLQEFVSAWDPDISDNFRNKIFLAESSTAVRKIFQGLLAVTDALILERSAPSDRDRLIARLEGIKTIYGGRYETLQYSTILAPGLETLIRQSEPSAADALTDTIDRLLESWKTTDALLEKADASPSLEDLRKQLIGAAERLGYPVESLQQTGGL